MKLINPAQGAEGAAMVRRGSTRREFLAEVGRGTLVASVGSAVAIDLGLAAPALAGSDEAARLSFGRLEPLVDLLQETPASALVSCLVEKIHSGTPLNDLVAAAALANARTFGGEDYVGFHTMMALAPAFHMTRELPTATQALPVLKVLYRNTNRIHEFGGQPKEVLHPVAPSAAPASGESLRTAVRAKDVNAAEAAFARLAAGAPADAFDALLYAVEDNTEVHRTVLPYRAWDLLNLIGMDQAHTLLRQSVRYCVKSERDWSHSAEIDRPRTLLPKLLEQARLMDRPVGQRTADDGYVETLSQTIFRSSPEDAAAAVAAALAEGFAPSVIGEAISLATNQLVLRDEGRVGNQVQPGKPAGSVHGDSIGVHACDSANAWRNMAAVSKPRNTYACLILGAYQAAHDRVNRGGDFLKWTARPRPEDVEAIRSSDPAVLLRELDAAIRANDQARACALVHKYGAVGGDAEQVFPVLLTYAVSEDGALHAEKFYRTVREEFTATRPAFRWRQIVALARVTASEYGRPAPGVAEARSLMKV
ncbi:MAG: hypothetical protein U0794_03115 [Isosphaeraceae bacterium]